MLRAHHPIDNAQHARCFHCAAYSRLLNIPGDFYCAEVMGWTRENISILVGYRVIDIMYIPFLMHVVEDDLI